MTDGSPIQSRPTKAKPLTLAGIVFTGLGILLLCFSALFAWETTKMARRNALAAATEPLRMSVDLSTIGTYTGRLDQVTSHTCKQTLALEADFDRTSEESVTDRLAGLKGRLIIRTSGNQPVLDTHFDADTIFPTFDSTTNVLWNMGFRLTPFRRDAYEVELHVSEHAPAMKGKPQFIVSRYILCGIEQLQVTVAGGIAFIGFFLAFLCFLPVIRFLWGKRNQEKPAV